MKTNVYIDGFNLYYGCIKGTPYKWLDVGQFCRLMLPHHTINQIKYFTARVRATSNDLQKPLRQEVYIRALRTIPNLSVHYGHFLSHSISMPLANPPATGPHRVQVVKTEEKGSDVNLATHLLVDAFDKDFDVAVIISNDSDLLEPIKVVCSRFGCQVGVLNPQKNVSWALKNVATFYKPIRQGVLKASQFPSTLTDVNGTITKPTGW